VTRWRSDFRQWAARRLGVPEIRFALERLAAVGFQPITVFDVGAYRGDFARLCLQIWPTCNVACFEALEPKVNELRALERDTGRVQVFDCLLGASAAAGVPFHTSETASSVLSEHHDQGFPVKIYRMRTIDDVVAERFASLPLSLLKIDVQGYELEVLRGAEGALSRFELILCELNLLDIHKGVPLLGEVVRWLDAHEFVAYDICGLTRRPLDCALWQADFIFVPKTSSLRADKRWKRDADLSNR
jgi:FkbM family methyltransferase